MQGIPMIIGCLGVRRDINSMYMLLTFMVTGLVPRRIVPSSIRLPSIVVILGGLGNMMSQSIMAARTDTGSECIIRILKWNGGSETYEVVLG